MDPKFSALPQPPLTKNGQERHFLCTNNNWHIIVLCTVCQSHHVNTPQRNCSTKIRSKYRHLKKTTMLMNYAATHPDNVIHLQTSDMWIHIDKNYAYLFQPNDRIQVAGNLYLRNKPTASYKRPNTTPNGPIITEWKKTTQSWIIAPRQKQVPHSTIARCLSWL